MSIFLEASRSTRAQLEGGSKQEPDIEDLMREREEMKVRGGETCTLDLPRGGRALPPLDQRYLSLRRVVVRG